MVWLVLTYCMWYDLDIFRWIYSAYFCSVCFSVHVLHFPYLTFGWPALMGLCPFWQPGCFFPNKYCCCWCTLHRTSTVRRIVAQGWFYSRLRDNCDQEQTDTAVAVFPCLGSGKLRVWLLNVVELDTGRAEKTRRGHSTSASAATSVRWWWWWWWWWW